MNTASLNRIADKIRSPEFATHLFLTRRKIEAALACGSPYEVDDLARDLDMPRPIARILLSYSMAVSAEEKMREAIEASSSARSEASH